MNNLAPIVLFVYNRLDHTKRTVEALKKNSLAINSDLYIVSDGYKEESDRKDVELVRQYISQINGFNKVRVVYRKKNLGLARNIISGVTTVIKKYGKVIVLEDDIVTSESFLEFMNSALEKYEDKKRVMSISGYIPEIKKESLPESFFLPWFDCWGWATWKDRWEKFERNPKSLIRDTNYFQRKYININGNALDLWNQVIDNYRNKRKTWAIFFHVIICQNKGLVFYPRDSYCFNAGFDGTGENCTITNMYNTKMGTLNISNYPEEIISNKQAVLAYEEFNRENNHNRVKSMITLLWQMIYRVIALINVN